MSKKKTKTPNKELTSEELTSLQQLLSVYNQSKIQLADTTVLHQEALVAVMANKEGFAKMENILVEKYGKDVSVNVQTGAITHKEDGSD
ncbi:MAG TPA: hypothetical protein EYO58_06100 [Flavobacteriales bacterium]|nr:hypothetical protein [Flavobacteriales bacterium]HIB77183.1 hypothetical protein [Flavobacteriales bacterium]